MHGVGVEPGVLAAAEAGPHPPFDRPGQAAPEGAQGHRDLGSPEAGEQLLQPRLGLGELLHVGGVQLLPLDERGQQLRLARALAVEAAPRGGEPRAQRDRLPGALLERRPLRRERGEVRAERGHPRVVAAGQGRDEAVPAEEVGGPVDRQQEPHVAHVAELVEGPRVGGEGGPGGGQARLELPDPRDGRVQLGPRALQGDLDLGELLGAQAQLQLQLLHLAEEALLLAAQPGELLLQGRAPLLDLAQPLRRRPSAAGRGSGAAAGASCGAAARASSRRAARHQRGLPS